jgi:CheY-like chemotaxis protein
MKKYKCIMLVDDSEMDILVGKAIIELSGITEEICVAINGIQGLNKLGAYYFKNKFLPEVILVDLVLPMMDGFELVEEIVKFPGYSRGNCKIIVLTGNSEDEKQAERLKLIGVKGILEKPLDKLELLEVINK